MAQYVRISVSEAHNAVKRLELAGLATARTRTVLGRKLLDFLYHGVPHAFPPILGPHTAGVPVAHPSLPAQSSLRNNQSIVWPWEAGSAAGIALMPLYRTAPRMVRANRRLYELLVLVDLLRVGCITKRDAMPDLLLAHGLKHATWS